mmetsp:Transcript_64370/g.186590  ORF Transcript_64370/g.186590 Transcript_64370/m.186590 type:complete len:242 (+) Transcript_64370:194-919(+)
MRRGRQKAKRSSVDTTPCRKRHGHWPLMAAHGRCRAERNWRLSPIARTNASTTSRVNPAALPSLFLRHQHELLLGRWRRGWRRILRRREIEFARDDVTHIGPAVRWLCRLRAHDAVEEVIDRQHRAAVPEDGGCALRPVFRAAAAAELAIAMAPVALSGRKGRAGIQELPALHLGDLCERDERRLSRGVCARRLEHARIVGLIQRREVLLRDSPVAQARERVEALPRFSPRNAATLEHLHV